MPYIVFLEMCYFILSIMVAELRLLFDIHFTTVYVTYFCREYIIDMIYSFGITLERDISDTHLTTQGWSAD